MRTAIEIQYRKDGFRGKQTATEATDCRCNCSDDPGRGNASNCRRGLMVVERTINVGFHSHFGTFKRSRHSKTVTILAITNEFPFNPTYDS